MNPQHFATQQQQHAVMTAARTGSGGVTQQQYATVGAVPLHAWTPPTPVERQHFDALFALADEEQRGAIGGHLAVAFFSRSRADKQVLREVWGLADTQRKGELSRNEFYVAMRLLAMAQRSEPVSVQRFAELAAAPFPLPVLDGVPTPSPVPQSQQFATMGVGGFGSAPSPAAATGVVRGPYAVTDEEKTRYDAIFAQYDADSDGFLLGSEAVALFQLSGLDRNLLREIWTLADRGQDSRLDVKEFYVAMHLIVCASKRGLPVPPQLPHELVESVFGAARESFPSEFTGGAPNSQGGSMNSGGVGVSGGVASDQPSAGAGDDDPFAGLSSAGDGAASVAPRMGSFTATSDPQPTPTPTPEPRGSFQQQPTPTPPGSARGSFYGVSTSSSGQEPQGGGFERTNSASMGSFSGMSYATPDGMMGFSTGASGPGPHGLNGMAMQMTGGAYGMPPAPGLHQQQQPPQYPQHMAPPKAFLSDEDEVQAVRQLDEQNELVTKCLAGVEQKQREIETLAEKLRDLDQLRHELLTLVMKRESVRASSAAAASSSSLASSSSASDRVAQQQTKLAVERSLLDLIEAEKRTVDSLQQELAALEHELQREERSDDNSSSSMSASFASLSLSSSGAPTPAPPTTSQGVADFSSFTAMGVVTAAPPSSSSSGSFGAPASVGAFDAFGDFEASRQPATTPAATTVFDFAAPSPAHSASSSVAFDGFGDFASKPAAPSPATAASTPNGFDAFANFSFN